MTPADARRVLLVDDDDDLREAVAQTLTLAGFDVLPVPSGAAALAALTADFAGLVVTDVRMPLMSGIELFRTLRARDADLPVILMTGHGDVAMAVEAIQAGAWDFLTKPFEPDALVAAANRAAVSRALALDNRRLRALVEAPDASALVGRSPGIVRLRETIGVLADADIDVFVEGESGTGKELIARLIHRGGRRARHPFVTVACAALPDALIEADLFGAQTATGRVRQAHRGTLFLDDLDRASPALQARLVELAEERALRAPGARTAEPLDLRIVSTGGGEDQPGTIQPALFYRLAPVRLRVPPLRERLEDVPLLFASLLDAAAARLRQTAPPLTAGIRRTLIGHHWPGNVRELANYADRVMLGIEETAASGPATAASLADQVAAFERGAICDAMAASGGDAGAAMAALGLPRKTFYYKVQRHGIQLADFRARG